METAPRIRPAHQIVTCKKRQHVEIHLTYQLVNQSSNDFEVKKPNVRDSYLLFKVDFLKWRVFSQVG